jgi:predicted DNA-binding transcriptional regulator YafY
MTRRSLAKFLGVFFSVPALQAAPSPRLEPHQPKDPLPPGDTRDPVALAFLAALERGGCVTVYYHGGSTPGAMRKFTPQSVYRLVPGGRLYATGSCHLRKETRTLRLDRARLG